MTIGKINPFAQTAQIKPTSAVNGETSSAAGATSSGNMKAKSSMFSGSTSGINTNIGVGEMMSVQGQAGKKSGIGRTLAFA